MATPDELLAQRADLDKQIAISNLDGLKAIQAVLADGTAGTLATDLTALLPQLASDSTMGTPFQQTNALTNVYNNVKAMVDREVTRIQALADADTAGAST